MREGFRYFQGVFAAACVGSVGSSVGAATVDVVNTNGTIPSQFAASNGGLDAVNFNQVDAPDGESLFLRARNRGDNGADLSFSGTTYFLDPYDGTQATRFQFDFQFTPLVGGTSADDYQLKLEIDTDPTPGVSFVTAVDEAVFGPGATDWEEGDSIVEPGDLKGGLPLSFNTAHNYVLSQSWAGDFGFLYGTNPGNGQYDIRLTLTESDSTTTVNTITAHVVPEPAVVLLSAIGGAALALRRWRGLGETAES